MSKAPEREDRLAWRRWGGKWVWPGRDLERGKTTRAVLSRVWYLFMPLLGIVCSQESYVRPHLVHYQDVTNRERKTFLDQSDGMKLRLANLRTDITNVQFDMDTTVIPQSAFYEMILDSLVQLRRAFDQSLPRTEALIDSLTGERDELRAQAQRTARLLERRKATRDSLLEIILVMEDSLVALADTIDAKEHLVYRILHPGEFRKETALFPGEGEYPDRDKLPRR